jgi:ketosteroid isomerase-like protein
MPSNAAIIRSVLDSWAAGDVETIVAAMAEDCELFPLRAQLEGTSYRGHEGVRRFYEDLNADWENLRLPYDEVREVGDRVVVFARLVARGRTSGVDLDVPIGQLWDLRDGRVVGLRAFTEPEDALRAAGAEHE